MRFLTSIVTFGVIVTPAIACAGGPTSPSTTPTPSPIATLTFVSGADNAPVAGARVNVAGNPPLVTDGAGQVILSSPVALDAALDATASGFESRLTLVRSTDPITLMPQGTDIQQLIFNEYMPGRRLTRPKVGTTIYLRPSAEIAQDPGALAAQAQAAAVATGAAAGAYAFVVSNEPPSGGVVFDLVINPDLASLATTTLSFSGNLIVGRKMNFKNLEFAGRLNTIAHEIGHAMGLGHFFDRSYLMHPAPTQVADFNDREKLIIKLMAQRNPGTEAPDNDRNTTAASRYPAEVTVSMDGDEPVITIHNRSDQALRDLIITARLEGAFAVNAQTRAAGQVISYLPVSMSGAIRVPAQQRFSGDSGTITVQVTDASGRLVAEPSGIITVACGH